MGWSRRERGCLGVGVSLIRGRGGVWELESDRREMGCLGVGVGSEGEGVFGSWSRIRGGVWELEFLGSEGEGVFGSRSQIGPLLLLRVFTQSLCFGPDSLTSETRQIESALGIPYPVCSHTHTHKHTHTHTHRQTPTHTHT